jgi:hypothetical protein
MTTEVVLEALNSLGDEFAIAEKFGVTRTAARQWLAEKFPPGRVLELYHHCGRAYDLEELLAK